MPRALCVLWQNLNCNLCWETQSMFRNRWVSGLCPSSGYLNNHKAQRLGNWVCFRPQVQERGHLFYLSSSERANLNHLDPIIEDSSKGPNRVGVFSTHLNMETHPVSERGFAGYIEFRMMDKVQKSSDSACYTSSPDAFRICKKMFDYSLRFRCRREYC
jgi:hypothetical protein